MHLSRREFLLASGGAVGALLASCGGASPLASSPPPRPSSQAAAPSPSAPAPSQRPLDVVKRGNLKGNTPGAVIASERGYFKELGIDDQEVTMANGAQTTQALNSGQVDMGLTSITAAFFNSLDQGIRQPFVLDNTRLEKGNTHYMVVVQPKLAGTIKQVADLRGRKNAVSTPVRDGGIWFVMQKLFDQAKMTFEEVEWVSLGFPDQLVALGNGGVDAAWLSEPFISLGKQKGLLTPWLNLGDSAPGTEISGLVYAERFIKERHDVAQRWAVGYVRGLRDYNSFLAGKDSSLGPILAKYTGIKEDAIEKAGWAATDPDGKINADSLMEAQQLLLGWGKIHKAVPREQILDPEFSDYAVKQLGPYAH